MPTQTMLARQTRTGSQPDCDDLDLQRRGLKTLDAGGFVSPNFVVPQNIPPGIRIEYFVPSAALGTVVKIVCIVEALVGTEWKHRIGFAVGAASVQDPNTVVESPLESTTGGVPLDGLRHLAGQTVRVRASISVPIDIGWRIVW